MVVTNCCARRIICRSLLAKCLPVGDKILNRNYNQKLPV